MRLIVLGATGRTGREVVRLATGRGHQVTAAARTAPQVRWPDGVVPQAVDVTDPDAVTSAAAGVDAAVFAVGIGASRRPTTIYSAGIANVLSALAGNSAARLSVISAAPAAARHELPRGQRLAVPLLSQFFGTTYADMRRMEQQLLASAAHWVCLRPPRLTGGRPSGSYRLGDTPVGARIVHADLAAALLDVLDDPQRHRCRLFVSGGTAGAGRAGTATA